MTRFVDVLTAATVALTLSTLTLSTAAHALKLKPAGDEPSFSCDGSLTSVEQKICSTQALINADLYMARIYDSVKERIRPRSDVSSLVADQKRWLAKRDACWSTGCIIRAYSQRIDTLKSWAVIRDD